MNLVVQDHLGFFLQHIIWEKLIKLLVILSIPVLNLHGRYIVSELEIIFWRNEGNTISDNQFENYRTRNKALAMSSEDERIIIKRQYVSLYSLIKP